MSKKVTCPSPGQLTHRVADTRHRAQTRSGRRKSSRRTPVQSEIPGFEQLSCEFQGGLQKLSARFHLELAEANSEAYIAYVESLKTFDPSRGAFSRRWWFFVGKRLTRLCPPKSDALAHAMDIDNELFENLAASEEGNGDSDEGL